MSAVLRYASIDVGFELPPLELPPISRATLAYFAGASGDRNPIHLDSDFARSAGQPDVFAHGMLVMAVAGRLLTDWAGPKALRQFEARFMAITWLHEQLCCRGRVVGKSSATDSGEVELAIEVHNSARELKLAARAVVFLD